jgi:hypothetical protein
LRSNGRVRGTLSLFRGCVQRCKDGTQDTLHCVVSIIILNANNLVSKALKSCCSSCIPTHFFASRMGRSIDFDDKSCLSTNKVGNITANRLLTHELETVELPIAQLCP